MEMKWHRVRERAFNFQMGINAGSHYFRIHPKRSINATGKTVHLPALITKSDVPQNGSYTVIGTTRCLRIKQFAVCIDKRVLGQKKKVISARAFAAICELKYYELWHQSENCNFIKTPFRLCALYIAVTVNRAEVIVRKSEKKGRKQEKERRRERWRRRKRRRGRVFATIINGCCDAQPF